MPCKSGTDYKNVGYNQHFSNKNVAFGQHFFVKTVGYRQHFFQKSISLASNIDANSKQMVNIFQKSGIFAAFLEYNKNDVSAISGAMAQGGWL